MGTDREGGLRAARPTRRRRELVLPESGVDGEDLPAVDAPYRSALRHVTAYGGQRDVPEQLSVRDRVGQVVPGGPHGRTPRGRFEGDQSRPEGTTAEQEVSRGRELRRHVHSPVELVSVGLHPQEGPCVHGAAPYRRR